MATERIDLTEQEKKFYELFNFPMYGAYWSFIDLMHGDHVESARRVAVVGFLADSTLTEKGKLFIKWYRENYLSEFVELIDRYLKMPECRKFFYSYKSIIFTPEIISEILSLSNNPEIIAKLLS